MVQAETYLRISDGNINAAISLFLESGGSMAAGEEVVPDISTSLQNEFSYDPTEHSFSDVRAPVAPVREQLLDHNPYNSHNISPGTFLYL